jgi:predicted negative regulator of RcsB-dependent stress response
MNLLANLNKAKPGVIIKHGETIKKDFSSTPYAVISSLAMAKTMVKQGDLAAAGKHLQWALQHADLNALKHIIRIRLARVLIAQGKLNEALSLLNSVKPGKFVAAYEEQKGNVFRMQGKNGQALAAWKRALKALPDNARIRAILQLKVDELSVTGKES